VDLRRALERLLAGYFGRPHAIANVVRRPSPYASTFSFEEIDVMFADGSALPLVVKDSSRRALLARGQDAQPDFVRDHRREVDVYRLVLPYAPHGAPIHYGHIVNPAGGAMIFLERVDGLELRNAATFSKWELAARWIARFHRSFATVDLEALAERSKLLVYDESFYWRWLERAQRFAPDASMRRVVDRIARGYGRVVSRLTALPHTVIHGEFYPSNILVRRTDDDERVSPIDWEMTALGPGLIDLAALATGWSNRAQRALMRAYREATSDGLSTRRRLPSGFSSDVDSCRLHLAIRMIGWSASWRAPAHHARDWLTEAEVLADRLRA
jgi:hypothetical protein